MKTSPLQSRHGERGLTLVEVSIAVLVVAIGLLSVLAVFPVGLRWSAEARNKSVVPHVAETVATFGYTHSTPFPIGDTYASYDPEADPVVATGTTTALAATTADYYVKVTTSNFTVNTVTGKQYVVETYKKGKHIGDDKKNLGTYVFRMYK